MVLRVRVARSTVDSLTDISLGVLLGLTLALVGLAWVIAPHAIEMSPGLAKFLVGF